MNDWIKNFDDLIIDGLEDLAYEFSKMEINYNNADITSGQQIYSTEEIIKMIVDYIIEKNE